ncbi:MAG: ROK family protein [Paracoccaceae bacterium]
MSRSERLSHSDEQRGSGKQHILNAIRAAGNIARIDIAARTRVSPATVTAITADLIAAGIVEEVIPDSPTQDARRGRPRVALKIRGDAHKIAGIKVSRNSISTLVTDFEGEELVSHDVPLQDSTMQVDGFCDAMCQALSDTCEKGGFGLADLSGIGVAMAGLVDAPRNFVHWSSSLIERNVDLGAALSGRLPCPVFVDNDANLVAKAEHLLGAGRRVDNFVVITIEHGVGMGIVINDKVYRGIRGCGAEFGHTKVQLEGALCQCGQRGCLEAYVGDYALLREANITANGTRYADLAALYNAVADDDPLARSVLDRAGRMFALGLANVINIFDPELIILSGERLSLDFLRSDSVLDQVQQWTVQVDAPLPDIEVHNWDHQVWARGAAAYAIEEVSIQTIRDLTLNVG